MTIENSTEYPVSHGGICHLQACRKDDGERSCDVPLLGRECIYLEQAPDEVQQIEFERPAQHGDVQLVLTYLADKEWKKAYSNEFRVYATDGEIDCSILENEINNQIKEANYCEQDSDCVLASFGCPFSCGTYLNKDADIDKIREDVALFEACPRGGCMYKCHRPKNLPVCKENRCKVSVKE